MTLDTVTTVLADVGLNPESRQ